MLMDIITLFFLFALGWFLGRHQLIWSLRNLIKDHPSVKSLELQTKIPVCVIESEGNQMYLYDKDTHAFYCQASSISELAINLHKNKNINTAFAVEMVGNQPKIWMFKEGKSELTR